MRNWRSTLKFSLLVDLAAIVAALVFLGKPAGYWTALGLAAAAVFGVVVSLAVFLVAIVVLLVLAGTPAGYGIALALVAAAAGACWAVWRSHRRTRALLEQGVPAEATVLEVWHTGLTINDNPRVGLRLEVRPAGGPPYGARTRMVIPRLMAGQLRAGSVLKVRYDPQNPQRVEWDTSAKVVVSPRALQRMAELEELWRGGLVTEEEYERKRREVLDST